MGPLGGGEVGRNFDISEVGVGSRWAEGFRLMVGSFDLLDAKVTGLRGFSALSLDGDFCKFSVESSVTDRFTVRYGGGFVANLLLKIGFVSVFNVESLFWNI